MFILLINKLINLIKIYKKYYQEYKQIQSNPETKVFINEFIHNLIIMFNQNTTNLNI